MSYYWKYLSVFCVLLITFASVTRADEDDDEKDFHFPVKFNEINKRGIMKMRIGRRGYRYPSEDEEGLLDKRGIMKMRIGKRSYGDSVEDSVDELYAPNEYIPATNLRIRRRSGIRRMRMG
ncbi:unnamed protein product [Hymenolepis diminuta]|uniref:Uncharacterized protein n=1 Tax=Hymenolepis diminuta TaxID=6216 RepID=A0A564YMP0_HYMDI|nr:unnamed protein product [Hymenolepis diminuta]